MYKPITLCKNRKVRDAARQALQLTLLRLQIAHERSLAAPYGAVNCAKVELCQPAVNQAAKWLLESIKNA